MRGIGLATTAPTGTTNFTDPTSGMVSVSATQPFVFTPVYVPGSAAVASYDPPSLAAGDAASSFTVEVTGAFVGDAVTVTLTSVDGLSSFDPAGMQITAYVLAADSVRITYRNVTAANLGLAAYRISVTTRRF